MKARNNKGRMEPVRFLSVRRNGFVDKPTKILFSDVGDNVILEPGDRIEITVAPALYLEELDKDRKGPQKKDQGKFYDDKGHEFGKGYPV